jgi:CheY-like chemotaxis protein
MLAFARRQDLKTEAVDGPNLVRGMTDLLQRSLGPHVSIETRFPLVLAGAHGDINQLELAILNLALNARDAMPDGGRIILAAREETVFDETSPHRPGCYVCIAVTDTGEGMDEATLARATEPFFTTKGVGKGTGLGLAMVHGMAQQLGGSLILRSHKGTGTTAEIWLPVADKLPVGPVSPPEPQSAKTRPLRILAVDDDALVLMNTTAMLEELGHTVCEAYSGKEAFDIIRKDPAIDLIITDQAMPQMTGVQLAEAVRRNSPHLPIVLATGYAELPPGPDLGLVKLAKPFFEQDLARVIAEVLDPKRIKAAT